MRGEDLNEKMVLKRRFEEEDENNVEMDMDGWVVGI